MIGFHFAFIVILIYAILLLGAGFIAGYGFRKGWDRAGLGSRQNRAIRTRAVSALYSGGMTGQKCGGAQRASDSRPLSTSRCELSPLQLHRAGGTGSTR